MSGASGRVRALVTLLTVAVVVLSALLVRSYSEHRREDRAERERERSEIVDEGTDQKLQKFSLKGFDDQGKVFWNLEGETANIDPGQTVFLHDNVTFRLQDNTVVRTDKVKWSPEDGAIRTDEPVLVEHQNVTIKGLGAVGRPKESFIQLHRSIEMVINGKTHLSCKGPMKLFYKDNKVVFYRDVKIRDERGTLAANRMDVFFDPEDRKIKEVVAEGNVVVMRGLDTSRSKRAIYTVATGAVRLEGNPEITIQKESGLIDASFRN